VLACTRYNTLLVRAWAPRQQRRVIWFGETGALLISAPWLVISAYLGPRCCVYGPYYLPGQGTSPLHRPKITHSLSLTRPALCPRYSTIALFIPHCALSLKYTQRAARAWHYYSPVARCALGSKHWAISINISWKYKRELWYRFLQTEQCIAQQILKSWVKNLENEFDFCFIANTINCESNDNLKFSI